MTMDATNGQRHVAYSPHLQSNFAEYELLGRRPHFICFHLRRHVLLASDHPCKAAFEDAVCQL